MTGRLAGRSILVTGSTGIAAALAALATAEGAATFVVSRTAEHARSLAERTGGGWAAADLVDETAVDRSVAAAIAHLGRIDGVLSVAGGSGRRLGDGPIHELTAAGWDGTIELNLRSQALVARAVTRAMLDQAPRGGSIVLVSSVLATRPIPELFATHAYAAAKGAIIALGTTMAATYARDMIRVNVIAPGLTETPMAQRAADDPATVEFARRKQPLVDGLVAADDVARAALYLLSDEARAVTGQVLAVDGGWSVTGASATPA